MREASPDAIKKVLAKVTRALTALANAVKTDPGQAYSAREKVVAALRDLDTRLDGWVRHLDCEQAVHVREREAALERRREDLRRSAEEAGWRVLRRRDYDIVDCFRVDYKKERVTVRLGSERLDAFDEVDGKGLLSRLRAAREALDRVPFDRLGFLQDLKDATGVAGVLRRDRNGRVPIRKLYPLVALIGWRGATFVGSAGKTRTTSWSWRITAAAKRIFCVRSARARWARGLPFPTCRAAPD